MRRWIRLLPAFIWLRLVRKHGEFMPVPPGAAGSHDGHGILVVRRDQH